MRIKFIYQLLLLVPVISACQGEEATSGEPQVPEVPKRVYTVKATLPGSDQTRTHITYGNPDPEEEIFRWHPIVEDYNANDYIYVFNVTRLSECPDGIQLNAVKVDGNTADFESVELGGDPDFKIKAGDTLFVNYWETKRTKNSDGPNFFTIETGTTPQLIVTDPSAPSYMTYMKGNLKMYDIVTAVEDDKIPDIHFRHLSAIMRVTLRNETGRDFEPKILQFDCTGDPFCPATIYCDVETETDGSSVLRIYNVDSSGIDGSAPYTNIAKGDINNYTAAETEKGTFIKPGASYDLYVSAVPRLNNTIKSETLTISLGERVGSSDWNFFTMTLDGFNTIIEAGKRYWFNLTAVEEEGEYKLVFTNKWLKDHPEQNTGAGE